MNNQQHRSHFLGLRMSVNEDQLAISFCSYILSRRCTALRVGRLPASTRSHLTKPTFAGCFQPGNRRHQQRISMPDFVFMTGRRAFTVSTPRRWLCISIHCSRLLRPRHPVYPLSDVHKESRTEEPFQCKTFQPPTVHARVLLQGDICALRGLHISHQLTAFPQSSLGPRDPHRLNLKRGCQRVARDICIEPVTRITHRHTSTRIDTHPFCRNINSKDSQLVSHLRNQ